MGGMDWTIIDTETTGIASPIYTLEIAAQRMRGLVPVGRPFQVFLNHEVDVPREAQAVHGYSRKYLQEKGISPKQAHHSFAEYVAGTPLAAYNLPYDYDRVLVPEWSRLGLRSNMPRGFCVMRLTQKIFSPSPAGNYKLQSLRAHFRLPEREAHSALGDVLTVVDLIGSTLSPHLQRLGLADASAISRYLDGAGYPEHLPFGKHKGRHWKEAVTDRDMLGWLQWLGRQDDSVSSKMAQWYLAQVDRLLASPAAKPAQPSTKDERVSSSAGVAQATVIARANLPCPHCSKMLAIPKGRSGTVQCPICSRAFQVDTR
jgi:DNA polymerase III epsilon subunit-like protein